MMWTSAPINTSTMAAMMMPQAIVSIRTSRQCAILSPKMFHMEHYEGNQTERNQP